MTQERTDRRSAVAEARRRLGDYIDALCAGPAAAPAYTPRLAVAATLTSLLRHLRSVQELRELVRREDAAFPRELLATEQGRKARSAFNLFARAVLALEDHRAADGSIVTGPEAIVGEQLSSVTFVQDYIQLNFDGSQFSALCPIHIHSSLGTVRSGDQGFRDRLCEVIGQVVCSISVRDDAVAISFDNCQVELMFASHASLSPVEPLIFHGEDHYLRVFTTSRIYGPER